MAGLRSLTVLSRPMTRTLVRWTRRKGHAKDGPGGEAWEATKTAAPRGAQARARTAPPRVQRMARSHRGARGGMGSPERCAVLMPPIIGVFPVLSRTGRNAA